MGDERIYPIQLDALDSFRRGHLFRYMMALGFVNAKDDVLDVACGCGYGTEILASTGATVIGVDYSKKAIDFAEEHHSPLTRIIKYVRMDLDEWEPLKMYDVVVSFETIEHLKEEPKVFADKLKRSTARTLIVSAPIVPTVGTNPHHRHDLTDEQMIELFTDENFVLFEKIQQRCYGVYVFVRKSQANKMKIWVNA